MKRRVLNPELDRMADDLQGWSIAWCWVLVITAGVIKGPVHPIIWLSLIVAVLCVLAGAFLHIVAAFVPPAPAEPFDDDDY